ARSLSAALRFCPQPPVAAGGRRPGPDALAWRRAQQRLGRGDAQVPGARAAAAGSGRAGPAHQRCLRPGRIERRHGGQRSAERRRPLAHDAGAAGGGRPAGDQRRRAHHPHAQRAAD
ncbi:MAG: General secretion pathway protein E / Type II secretion cytoplasmic ATP binding protein (PulE, ATPase), partial [uncultured Ramlibacter sp.]